jgi:acetyltransferase-like isoleucine patch superfamily enzyme
MFILKRISYYFVKMKTVALGIKLSEGCVFYGVPLLKKTRCSTISIGRRCVCRTSAWSNSAGVKQRTYISTYDNGSISIGDDCGISASVISARSSIIIGDRVLLGVNCTLIDNDRHDLSYANRKNKKEKIEAFPITIENDVWLGMNVVVMKGVTIGSGSVIGANSIVTKDIPSNVLAAGNPAKVIRSLNISKEES